MAEFDSIHKIHKKLLGRSHKDNYLEFDDDLFENGKIYLVNAKTGKKKEKELKSDIWGI